MSAAESHLPLVPPVTPQIHSIQIQNGAVSFSEAHKWYQPIQINYNATFNCFLPQLVTVFFPTELLLSLNGTEQKENMKNFNLGIPLCIIFNIRKKYLHLLYHKVVLTALFVKEFNCTLYHSRQVYSCC